MFFEQVPRDLEQNIAYRIETRKRAAVDMGFRHAVWQACKEDVLYFFSAFCWLYEPRPRFDTSGRRLPKMIPMIPWEHQIDPIKTLDQKLGVEDIVVFKSRGEGLSWIGILFAVRDWLFDDMAKVGIVSNSEKKADDPGNMDSLGAKCLAVGTNVLTPSGWKKIEDIAVGDEVIGSHGKPTMVSRVMDEYESDMIRLTFSDGTDVTCTPDHLWPVSSCTMRMSGNRKNCYHKYVNMTAEEISETLRPSAASMQKHWNWQVQPISGCVEFPTADLAIAPYVMGVLLGDGCLCKTALEFASVDNGIVDRVRLDVGNEYRVTKTGRCSWIIATADGNVATRNGIGKELRKLGIRGCRSWEKFIPREYLLASREQRIALLRGLMDTDGTLHKSSGAVYCTVSRKLADDVAFLVRSLGGVATVTDRGRGKFKHNGENKLGRVAYKVFVHLLENPFHLVRKAASYKPRKHTTAKRIIAASRTGKGMVKCITVDAEDGLFVTEGLTLTHNCDWELSKLPTWMVGEKDVQWKRNLADHSWVNHRNGSQINAFAATADAGRAGRYKWFMADELAFWDRGKDQDFMDAIRGSTDCRFAVSTPLGSTGAFYDMVHKPSRSVTRIRIHWTQNPVKNRGLYKMANNVPVAVDKVNNPLLPEYYPVTQDVLDRWSILRSKGFRLETGVRSPWYDYECDRADATPQSIAQELDLDFGGSMYRVFSPEFFAKTKETVRQPVIRGTLTYHPETLEPEFIEEPNGLFKLWVHLDSNGRPPRKLYAVADDISSGLGGSHTSNSVCQIIDLESLEQVATFATNIIEPSEFGEFCVVVAKWWHNAYLGWENNFGGGFTKRVKDLGYGNVYYSTQVFSRGRRKTTKIGWNTNPSSKELMFADFHRMVKNGQFVVRDEDLVRECSEYVRLGPQSKIQHVLEASTSDGSSKGEAHGDRVIAMCIGVQLAKDRGFDTVSTHTEAKPSGPPPPDTLAWRVQKWEEEDNPGDWDDRTTGDLAHPGRVR